MPVLRRSRPFALWLCVVALLAPACHRVPAPSANVAKADDFHPSDPAIVGTTGRPQLLEFYGPT